MSWSRALLLTLALGACGFEPVNTASDSLRGRVAIAAPESRESFILVARLEERLGRATNTPYALEITIEISEEGLALDAEGDVRRFNLIGAADFALRDTQTGEIVQSDRVESFTGYSSTGTIVVTLAARRDAEERLMTILADQIVRRLQAAGAPA